MRPARARGGHPAEPGNIRELENAVERAAVLAEGNVIRADDLRLGDFSTMRGAAKEPTPVIKIPSSGIALEEIERQALLESLKMSNIDGRRRTLRVPPRSTTC